MASEAQCAGCGAPITPGARFCMTCGADISGEQARVATKVSPARPGTRAGNATQALQRNLLEALRDATLGEYEILAELGRGGMATVFLAHDIQLDRKVAIKVMNPQLVAGEGMVERFKLEARTSAGLSHPHIIPIYAVRQTDDLLYFVMKFIEGRPLDSIIKQSAPLPIPMARSIVTKVGEALGYAHRRGVVHRDIKPANIMIDIEGMPIVTDFGIAKVADKQGLTMTGATIGTPTYMSPEQCNAQPITGASDQYSLGVMAYEMLTGRPLYDGDSVMTIMFKHVHDAPPAPETLGSQVPRDLAEAITRMLRKAPAERWPTIEDALPIVAGSNLAYDDSVRTQMVQFARAGSQREILDRVSTPRSPIPVGAVVPIESAETVRVSSGVQGATRQKTAAKPKPRPAPAAAAAPARPAPRSRTGLLTGLAAVLVLGAGGALAVLKPWAPAGSAVNPADSVTPPAAPPSQPAAGTAESTVAAPPASPPRAPVSAPAASVTPVPTALRITRAPTTLQSGETGPVSATVEDQDGREMNRPVTWASSDVNVARIRNGQVEGLAEGRATLTARAGALSSQTTVQVVAVPVASVAVDPGRLDLLVGGPAAVLRASPTAADGASLTDRLVAWQSSDQNVATVSPTGRVTPVGAGTATISATSGGVSGSAQIQVRAPVAAAPPPSAPAASPTAPAQPVPDPQIAIGDLVRSYAAALESQDLARVRALYPTMPRQQERDTREALSAMENLKVQLAASGISVNGDQATANVTGQWLFKGGKLDIRNTYEFQRRADGWRIVAIH
jgi:serine/threonine-protein kinase